MSDYKDKNNLGNKIILEWFKRNDGKIFSN